MGYINALYDLGNLVMEKSGKKIDTGDRSNYLQMPIEPIADSEKRGREIRIWLKVVDITADMLDVIEVKKMDTLEYPHTTKEAYMYRDVDGKNSPWRFSPIYKLGTGEKDAKKALLGKGDEKSNSVLIEWLIGRREKLTSDEKKAVKDSRYYKIKSALLDDLEKEGVLAPGSVSKIMQWMISNVDQIAERWSDRNRSYIIVFGVDNEGKFLYPGEVSAFQKYFDMKLKKHLGNEGDDDGLGEYLCAVCGKKARSLVTIDKLIKFGNFDKPSFLPGGPSSKDIAGVKEKIYPICGECFAICSVGSEKVKSDFSDNRTVSGLNIDIIPELAVGTKYLDTAASKTKEFIQNGVKMEAKIYNRLAAEGEALVFHFMFWESNNSQQLVHLLVEDVPPTRLKQILKKWNETLEKHGQALDDSSENTSEDRSSIDHMLKLTYKVLMTLAGKNSEDKKIMKERWIHLVGKLLKSEKTNVNEIKMLMVSRFPGVFGDHEQFRKYGRKDIITMAILVDFLSRMNEG